MLQSPTDTGPTTHVSQLSHTSQTLPSSKLPHCILLGILINHRESTILSALAHRHSRLIFIIPIAGGIHPLLSLETIVLPGLSATFLNESGSLQKLCTNINVDRRP